MVNRASRSLVAPPVTPSKILPKFFFVVSARDEVGGGSVHITDIARVAAVAAAKIFRRAFEHEHTRARAPRRNRRAQRRIAAADDENVIGMLRICH